MARFIVTTITVALCVVAVVLCAASLAGKA